MSTFTIEQVEDEGESAGRTLYLMRPLLRDRGVEEHVETLLEDAAEQALEDARIQYPSESSDEAALEEALTQWLRPRLEGLVEGAPTYDDYARTDGTSTPYLTLKVTW